MLFLRRVIGSTSIKVTAEKLVEFSATLELKIKTIMKLLRMFSTLILMPSIFSLVKMSMLIHGLVHSKVLMQSSVLVHIENPLLKSFLLLVKRAKRKRLQSLKLIRILQLFLQSKLKPLLLMLKLSNRNILKALRNSLFIFG